jgi:dienelactone hydrolase
VEGLTLPQLKQQLRLRGLKVSGRKAELVDRLLSATGEARIDDQVRTDDSMLNMQTSPKEPDDDLMLEKNVVIASDNGMPIEPEVIAKSKARKFAEARGKDLIDVTAYLDDEDVGKQTKTNKSPSPIDDEEILDTTESLPEAWGKEAKIVDDYEGRAVVIDNLSRCRVEFRGSNQTMCQAYVVASRDALKAFLAGGTALNVSSAEERLREIQLKREDAAKRPWKESNEAVDQDDEPGYFKDILHREFSDWGEYTTTGAQLSAAEVQGVLLLSDVHGPFSDDMRALAEKIAFECQPVVVMSPDLFRGFPWEEVDSSGLNAIGQTYEQWRATHDELRVSVDIRAAAACLRERYGVSSVVVWGTCYGGGRALEAASGYFPDDNVHDVDGTIGPMPVDPMACIAWYPTRYNAKELFGVSHRGRRQSADGSPIKVAVMAIFAGKDTIAGATPGDAATLKDCLDVDERVNDHMVKVFSDQNHGFAHIGLAKNPEELFKEDYEEFVDEEFGGSGRVSLDSSEAEVACLLSTAWMETYSRVFLPTVGPIISKDANEFEWQTLSMKDLSEANNRDIREEIEKALDEYSFVPDGRKLDRFDEESHEEIKRLLMEYQTGQDAGENEILPSDDLNTAYEKLKRWDGNIQLF